MKLLLDVFIILDVLEKEGSFVVVLVKFYKIFLVLSYMVYKLESDLNIQIFDCFGYWVCFICIG